MNQTRRPKITVSKDTTFVTGPLGKEGYVDYVAAINEATGRGVTTENNAAIDLLLIPWWLMRECETFSPGKPAFGGQLSVGR
jgi:hypothetical protein